MKSIKKIFIIAFGIMAIGCFAVFGLNARTSAFADGVANESDYCVYGGAVKIKDERGAGVKFHVVMTEDYFKNYGTIGSDGRGTINSGVKTGTLLLPYRLTNGADLTVGGTGYGAKASDSDTSGVWHKIILDGQNYMESVVYLYNIPETDFGTEISVRGYIQKDGAYIYTAQENGISMSFVAQAEFNDGNSQLTAAEKDSLKQTYLDKKLTYHLEGVVSNETLDYLGTTAGYPEPKATLDDGSEFVGWATKDGTIVKNLTSTRVKNDMDLYAVYRQKLLMTAENVSLSLANYAGYNVESIKIGEYDLGSDPTSLNVSALKADAQSHGEQNVTVVLTKDGERLTATLPVLIVTKEISSLADFLGSCRYYGKGDIYGYYVLTKDISYTEGFGSYSGAATYAWRGDKKGFKGVLDGQGHKITWHCSYLHGIFGTLYEATIKNITLAQAWYNAGWGSTLIARNMYYTNLENVDMTIASDPQTTTAEAPILEEMAGCKWKNCTISSSNSVGVLIEFPNKDGIQSTYENVTITANASTFGTGIPSFDSIEQVKAEKTSLTERQDFVLDGETSVLDLGEYNGLEILSVKTSNGETLNGIASTTAGRVLTDKQKHGEQSFIVTVLKENGGKVEITVPVTVITKAIKTMSELQDAVKHTSGADNLYGYYVLENDVSYKGEGYVVKAASGGRSGDKAFRGTLDGRGFTITMNSSAETYGIFGTMNGATIKDVTIKDLWNNAGYKPIIARNAYNTAFSGVTIEIAGGAKLSGENDNTPIIGNTMQGCSLNNVMIKSSVEIVNVFANQSGNIFENVNIDAVVSGGFSKTDSSFPSGVTAGKKAVLKNTYDFALSGENKGIVLGEGYEDVTITKIEYDGQDVTETSSEALMAKVGENVTLNITAQRNSTTILLTVPAFVVTQKISTMAQFNSAVRFYGTNIEGYYVLANDISYSESGFAWGKAASVVYGASGGFEGTLDGRGKTITVNTNDNDFAYGMFGTMNGTLKNVTIEAMQANSYSKPIIVKVCCGTVENVNVNIHDMKHSDSSRAYANSATPALVETALYGAAKNVWKNVKVTVDTKVNCLFPAANVSATFENCTLTAPDYNGIKGTEKEVAGWTFVCSTGTTELTDSSERLINLNMTENGEINTTDTYTLDIEGLTESNFVSATYNGKTLATDGLTINVSEFGKTYGKGELEIEYLIRTEKRTHVVPVVLATKVIETAEDLRFF